MMNLQFKAWNISKRFPAIGIWRLAFGDWHLAIGIWRLAIGDWRLAIGDWRLAIGDWHLAIGIWRFPGGVTLSAFDYFSFSAFAQYHPVSPSKT
jgi:hypothetical protein